MKWTSQHSLSLYAIVSLYLFYWSVTRESYTSPAVRASDQTKADLNGKVRLAEKSVERTAWTNVTIKPKQKSGLEKFGSVFNPSETLIFKGQPKYVTKHNAIIVGKPFTFSVQAPSMQEAQRQVNKRAAEELEGINYVLKAGNLL